MRNRRKARIIVGTTHGHYHLHRAPVVEGHDHEHSHADSHHRIHYIDPARGIFDEGEPELSLEDLLRASIEAVKHTKARIE